MSLTETIFQIIPNVLRIEIMSLNNMIHLSFLTDFRIRVIFKDDCLIEALFQNQQKMMNHANIHQTFY